MAELFIGDRMTTSTSSSKIDISSATVTLVSNSFVYDGSVKTQAVQSVVLNGQTLVEGTDYVVTNYFKINAGTYTLAVRGIGNYDGVVTADWSIAKAASSVSLDKTEISLDNSNVSDTIAVTRAGNGVISAQSSDTSIATVSVSGTTVTVTGVASGSATVTVNVAAGDNYLTASATCSVSVSFIDTILANITPAQIQAVAQAGTGSSYWSVGDRTAPIHISAVDNLPNFTPPEVDVCAFIIGFNHNSSVEGTGIHFQFGKTTDGKDIAFCDTGYNNDKTSGTWFNMNNSYSSLGGWNGSRMKTVVCLVFKSALPSDWRSVIKGCKKWTDNTGRGSDTASYVTETTDDIFLLAEYEVFGTRTYANSAEQKKQQQYAYYANGNSKVKYCHDSIGTPCIWWLRSTVYNTTYLFVTVAASGSVNYNVAYRPYGFAPGFCIA